jgi:hypothetical protein
VGIGLAWIFLAPGRSTSPNRGPHRRTANAAAQQTIKLGTVQPKISHNIELILHPSFFSIFPGTG